MLGTACEGLRDGICDSRAHRVAAPPQAWRSHVECTAMQQENIGIAAPTAPANSPYP